MIKVSLRTAVSNRLTIDSDICNEWFKYLESVAIDRFSIFKHIVVAADVQLATLYRIEIYEAHSSRFGYVEREAIDSNTSSYRLRYLQQVTIVAINSVILYLNYIKWFQIFRL